MTGPEDWIAQRRTVLIAGATASGKTALALALAERAEAAGAGALIVNADSMQVYDGLRLLTARPTPEDEAVAPHRLFGHVPPSERYSVGRWLEEARAALGASRASGRVPIVVGGAGLYFRALIEGLVALPPIHPEIRARLERERRDRGLADLFGRLRRLDRETAGRIAPGDAQRVLRALEVAEGTGRPLSEWRAASRSSPAVGPDAVRLVLEVPRDALYRRIGERLDRMVAEGALEEVEALLALGLDPGLPAMKAIGLRSLAAAVTGAAPLDEALAAAKAETRRYAKRQLTWFRNQTSDWTRSTLATSAADRTSLSPLLARERRSRPPDAPASFDL